MTDRKWTRLEPLLPKQRTGRPPKDRRIILDAPLWFGKTGAPWRDLPERYGLWQTVAIRFYCWTRRLWEYILAELHRIVDARAGTDWDVHMVDGMSGRSYGP
jgi:transposase